MKRFACSLVLAVALAALCGAAQGAAANAARRFLLVVDTSFSMTRIAESTRLIVSNLVYTGIQGQLQPGEIFGLWTFNEHVYENRFQPLAWDPALNQAIANNVSRHLKDQKCEKQTRLDRLLPELNLAARNPGLLIVLFLSDGDDRFEGTPFDHQLNGYYRLNYRELRRMRKPFLTTLVAEGGRFVACSVTVAGEAIAFDDLAHQLAQNARLENLIAAAQPATNAAPATVKPTQTNAPPASVASAPSGLAATTSPPSQPPPPTKTLPMPANESGPANPPPSALVAAAPDASPTTRSNPPAQPAPPPVAATTSSVTPAAPPPSNPDTAQSRVVPVKVGSTEPGPAAPARISPRTAPVFIDDSQLQVGPDPKRFGGGPRSGSPVPQPTPAAASTETKPPSAVEPSPPPAAAPATAKVAEPPPKTPPPTAVAEPLLGTRGYLALSAGLFGLGLALGLWLLLRRRAPAPASFISRSIDRES